MNNLKPIMKQVTLGDGDDAPKGLLKKKPFGKTPTPKAPATGGLMQRLTGKC